MRHRTDCPAGPAGRPQPLSASARSAGCAVSTLLAVLFCARVRQREIQGTGAGAGKQVTQQDVLGPKLPRSDARDPRTTPS